MRNLMIRNSVLPASLFAILAASAITGCSTGSGSGGTAGTSGSAGTTGAAGSSTGTAGSSTGTAGSSTGTAGSGTGTAGSGTAGTGAGTAGTTGAAGAEATGTAGAPATTGVCAAMGTRALSIAQGKVDDFEADPISPAWSSFNNLAPAGTDNSIKIARTAGGAIATGFYGHYMGTGAKTPTMGGFGVGTLYNMAIDDANHIYCVDVTAFDGVTFWAKAGSATTTHVSVNFTVPETNMTPQGDCPGPTGCYNHPQKLITLTTEWAQYSVLFSAATGGTGAKVKGRIQQILFISPDSIWDFSIDELQLYKGTAPATPVGGNSTTP
jgi:CRISPR/Cas system-associated endoribonuclease Cas2